MATMIQHSFLQQCPSLSAFPNSSLSSTSISLSTSPISVKFRVYSCCQTSPSPLNVVNGNTELSPSQRTEIRFGLPSKGRMASDTLDLLKDCQLSVRQVNPRQYVAQIPQISNLEVWFQRPKDIVRKLLSGDLDLGIVGFDTVNEYAQVIVTTLICHVQL
ncbi:ATP phosphoribosyltransferase 2 chloroplastic [Bienertia sinuspersici]